jgi:hypothetical protein
MDATKPGFKTTEFIALIAGIIATVVPLLMDKIPPGSVWAVVLGSLLAVATYISGRSYLKAASVKSDAIAAIGATKSNPQ